MKKLLLLALLILFPIYPVFADEAADDDSKFKIKINKIQNAKTHKGVFLSIVDSDGKALPEEALEVVRDKKVHLFIISDDYSEFKHIHPDISDDGMVIFKFQPKAKTNYLIWANFQTDGDEYYIKKALIEGYESKAIKVTKEKLIHKSAGYNFKLSYEQPLILEEQNLLKFEMLQDAKGLQNIGVSSGVFSSVVAFTVQDGKMQYIEAKDEENLNENDEKNEGEATLKEVLNLGSSSFKFVFEPKTSGVVKIFAQVQLKNQDMVVPFTLNVSLPNE